MKKTGGFKPIVAGVGTAALAASLLIAGPTSALAAPTALGPDDIAGYENGDVDDSGYNYDQWHIGSNEVDTYDSTDFLDFGKCSITVKEKPDGVSNTTQVLKGYSPEERPDVIEDIFEVMESVEIDGTDGTTLQFPFFAYYPDQEGPHWVGTIRTSDTKITPESEMINSMDNLPMAYEDLKTHLIAALDADPDVGNVEKYELLGVGFTGETGTEVSKFSFGGDDFYFGNDCFLGFSDIDEDHSFYDEIFWLGEEGITTGFADGTFRPKNHITREATAAFLYRLAGKPAVEAPEDSPFSDVDEGDTFYDAIVWLNDQEITDGYEDGTFRPKNHITREAMAAFLYRLGN